jgi:hypothetical protein
MFPATSQSHLSRTSKTSRRFAPSAQGLEPHATTWLALTDEQFAEALALACLPGCL